MYPLFSSFIRDHNDLVAGWWKTIRASGYTVMQNDDRPRCVMVKKKKKNNLKFKLAPTHHVKYFYFSKEKNIFLEQFFWGESCKTHPV